MAFRNKADVIIDHKPDILIIPECETPERLSFGLYAQQPSGSIWYGDLPSKGIGVFTFNDYKIKLLDIHNPEFKYIIPLSIYNEQISYTVFAVWAQNTKNHYNYTQHVWHAIQYYQPLLGNENVILTGDFNSNTIWDKQLGVINHTSIVEFLKGKNIISTYHHFHDQVQGKEKHNTLYMQRNINKPYHIDYCFASSNLIGKMKNVEVGEYESWTKHSDHQPLMVTFD